MACTKHSAVDYVRNARLLLIEHLNNQSLIVDKLQQLKVFNFEHVRAIMSEKNPSDQTRHIVDFVTNEGEEASYLLLRILDSERGRTLPKDATPDLHQWISCFSFRQEPEMDPTGSKPCQQYQYQLKRKAQAILNNHLKQSKSLIPEYGTFCYAPLVLDTDGQQCPVMSKIKQKSKKYKMSRTKKLSTYIPSKEPQKSPEDLLKNGQDVLLVGKPGIGKTTITMEMINLWANMENRRLNYLFYFDETTLPDMSKSTNLESLLFDAYVEPHSHRAEVLQDIKDNSEHVVILFDGVKNVPFNSILGKILTKEILPEAKVVLTCRPEHEEVLPEWMACRVCVQGFNEKSLQNYLSSILQDKPDVVTLIMGNPELCSLCHVPIHALMVAACMLDKSAEAPNQCTATNIYLNIFRHVLRKCEQGLMKPQLDQFIRDSKEKIVHLCKLSFSAIKQRSILLQDCEDGTIERNFLNQLTFSDGPTYSETRHSFLHNTMQEFFAALWLLANLGEIDGVLHTCTNEEGKHMRHVIHFLSGLLSEKNEKLLKCLIPEVVVEEISHAFHEKLFSTFLQPPTDHGHEDIPDDRSEDLIFLCQCLFEMQSHQACSTFLSKIRGCFEFGDGCLDPYHCCAISYIIKQPKDSKVVLDLTNCDISEEMLKMILSCLQHISVDSCLLLTLWTAALGWGNPEHFANMLNVFGNELHLPMWETSVFKTSQKVICQSPNKINLVLHLDPARQPQNEAACNLVIRVLQHLKSTRLTQPQLEGTSSEECKHKVKSFLMDLCLQAALSEADSALTTVRTLYTLFDEQLRESDFLLDLYCHVKDRKAQTISSLLPALQPLYQSAGPVWSIDLSERKASLLLEVLKLQIQKRPVELRGWSDEESEVRSFLQCLPYISQLSFYQSTLLEKPNAAVQFLVNLSVAAAEWDSTSGERLSAHLSSACSYSSFPYLKPLGKYDIQSNFLLDLYVHLQSYGNGTSRELLLPFKLLYQSAPEVWSIDLSERRASLLLEVLKLQTQKRPVELRGWSDGESEVRSLVQCLPYISQLSFYDSIVREKSIAAVQFLVNLSVAAAEWDSTSGERSSAHLSSACSYSFFPHLKTWWEYAIQSNFLLDLYVHFQCHGVETAWKLLSPFKLLYQSAPVVWSIDLSERKASLLLEVLKLQTQKRPVELRGWSDEESEVRSFLQCLPYISELSFGVYEANEVEPILMNLCASAAEYCSDTGQSFPGVILSLYTDYFEDDDDAEVCDGTFLLDLCYHVKDIETKTRRSTLPSLQPLYQSAGPFWSIDLSERKASVLLEVLKLQTQKRQVELKGWSDEESEVRSFLQCLPYISQLSFHQSIVREKPNAAVQFLVNLSVAAAEWDSTSGERSSAHLSSACSYSSFPHLKTLGKYDIQSNFLLDLYVVLQSYGVETARRLLSICKLLYQSAPPVWSIDLSKRKASLLLEVLKLQTQKRQVELRGWSDEESEVRSFLQCLPYISQLSFHKSTLPEKSIAAVQFLVNLSVAAAECDSTSGERSSAHLSSACSYSSFPCPNLLAAIQCNFLLDLYVLIQSYGVETARRLLSPFTLLYQSAPPVWSIDLSKRKASLLLEVLKLQSQKRKVQLKGWSDEEREVRSFLQCLSYISQLSFSDEVMGQGYRAVQFLVNLGVTAAECDSTSGERFSVSLFSACSHCYFPLNTNCYRSGDIQSIFLLDLYAHLQTHELESTRWLISSFLPIYQSAPVVWSIDLSERKASLLLEVLKLQTQKRPVELRGWSDEESEVKSFLQCLPYISQLSFNYQVWKENGYRAVQFLVNLGVAAFECGSTSGERFSESMSSACSHRSFPLHTSFDQSHYHDQSNYDVQSNFLLDLYAHLQTHELESTRWIISSFLPIYQSAPAVWSIDLSKRKASVLLEVLKLQTQKRPVELRGWSDEESEVKSFLQCLPYISHLSFDYQVREGDGKRAVQFLVNLGVAAFECGSTSGERFSESLFSACSHRSFPLHTSFDQSNYDIQSNFLLDLYVHLQTHELESTRWLISSFLPIYQLAPPVWFIDLSERKASLLLEVLKRQTQKRPVELRGWSDEESEVRSFLQCLPNISQLRFGLLNGAIQFLMDLSVAAAECVSATGECFCELFSSVCSYSSFPFEQRNISKQSDLLLDLYSHVMDYESKHDRSLLSIFQPIYQSAPPVWSIDLSERKASLLIEVLKLQTRKRPVQLRGWSDEENEVRSFLQCLPYISQLSFSDEVMGQGYRAVQFLVNLGVTAAECDSTSGERFSVSLFSACSYCNFPLNTFKHFYPSDDDQSNFLLDLYAHLQTHGLESTRWIISSFLPIYQSAPAVWSIDLSKRKASVLLEVLKLQTQKRPVELKGWSGEESEVKSFRQCLPYISQLSFGYYVMGQGYRAVQFLVNLGVTAAECDSTSGERFSVSLFSACSYSSFPLHTCSKQRGYDVQSNFLLDLYAHLQTHELESTRWLISSFLPIYQSAPVVWSIDLSKRKASLLLEVLKLQSQKRQIELRGWSDEEREVRSFLQCLPYISQLSFNYQVWKENRYRAVQFLVNLGVAAFECGSTSGERFSESLFSACSHSSFPLHTSFNQSDDDDDDDQSSYHVQSNFLLDLYAHLQTHELESTKRLISSFLPIYQSAPAVWSIDLSKRKASLLLKVLKLQTQKRPVELRGWSDKEREVWSFLQCLPYVSQLSFYKGYNPQSAVLDCVYVGSQQELLQLFKTLNYYTLCLERDLHSSKCTSVGRTLGWIGSKLDVTLTPDHISLRGVKLMFRRVRRLHKLRLNYIMVVRLAKVVRTRRHCAPITVENLSLEINSAGQSPRGLSKVLSCLSVLLRLWTVHCLDLSSCSFESHSLIMLLSLQGPFKLRLRTKTIQLLVLLVSEVEDKEITESFLDKVEGGLNSCTLTKEVLLSLLQHSSTTVAVDYRKCVIREKHTLELLPLLDRIRFQRPDPGFIMSIIRDIYQTRSPHYVSSLLKSTENCLNLTTRVLDAADSTALHYTLQQCQEVKLNLMWTSTPDWALESIVQLLSNVSRLSVDRQQLLRMLHCCASSDVQQGASLALLQALQHRLDFSCSSAVDLTDDTQEGPMMHLRAEDCRVIAMVMGSGIKKTTKTQLTLLDCEVEEAGLEHLLWVLNKATLRCSKLQLLQFLALLSVGSERERIRRSKCLCLALGQEVDLSHTVLDQEACVTLALLLEYSEWLAELDLSHCQLSDHCLQPLLPHLHKTTVLDLSDNNITDIGAQQIYNVVNTTSSILTVRLSNNNIERKHLYQGDGRFELW